MHHSMGAPGKTTACERSKREDFEIIKEQTSFKEWKILIGPSDWNDHRAKKEGAEKYRTQNLPGELCPGIYELAIIISKSDIMPRKLDSSSVCVVYVGESDNVRKRLRQYGCSGDHLQKGCSNDKSTVIETASHKALELFSETFSRGHGIAYRWVPMDSKAAAVSAEKELLKEYDYAWNKHSNAPRREEDIWNRLQRPPKSSWFSRKITKLVSIIMKNRSDSSNTRNDFICSNSKNLRIKRVQPPVPCSDNDECEICGVAIGHGSICTKLPVKGRKRCPKHKGMRVNGLM